MRALIFHGSSVIGLLVLFNLLWNDAEIVRAVVTAFITGLAVYIVLMVGFVMMQRLIAQASAPTKEAASTVPQAGGVRAGPAAPAKPERASAR